MVASRPYYFGGREVKGIEIRNTEGLTMAKRGRPSNEGARDGFYFIRAALAVGMFTQSRELGAKYEAAIKETVARMHRDFPDFPFSASELKRVLKEFQPKNAPYVLNCELDSDGRGGTVSFRQKENNRVNRRNKTPQTDE